MKDTIGLPWESTYQSLDIGPGWLPVIERLHADLLKIDPNYVVAQVKEKFGGLRFYAYPGGVNKAMDANKAFYDRIRQAENEAAATDPAYKED
jgi:hypothetical protein